VFFPVDPHKKFKGLEKFFRYEGLMPGVSFIKCRDHGSEWNSHM